MELNEITKKMNELATLNAGKIDAKIKFEFSDGCVLINDTTSPPTISNENNETSCNETDGCIWSCNNGNNECQGHVKYAINVKYSNAEEYGEAIGASYITPKICPSLGDVNGDGGVSILDIVTLVNCVLAQTCGDLFNACAGDMNSDCGYNVLDIVTLANCVLANNCGDQANDCASDMNGDGKYNVLDIVSLANCVLTDDCNERIFVFK